mmetsp:Transcript_11971/g.27345  ORF Transcript_11971/g.27345 Transcript_11971/m.27345 type:complete len:101 (-) Transcript_11971:207-509(-)
MGKEPILQHANSPSLTIAHHHSPPLTIASLDDACICVFHLQQYAPCMESACMHHMLNAPCVHAPACMHHPCTMHVPTTMHALCMHYACTMQNRGLPKDFA